MTRSFDPVVEVQKVRDHLSSHDKPIAMLFGAGTSCAVNAKDDKPLIPAVAALTDSCEQSANSMGDPFPAAWALIRDSLAADRRNIEEILSSVRQKIDAILDADKLAGLDRTQLEALEQNIKQTIAKEVRPDSARIPSVLPHEALGHWLRNVQRDTPVEIYSLNYDTLVERGLEAAWVPFFDGFVGAYEPFFSPGSLMRADMLPGRRWARLWKLHGSVTWRRAGSGDSRRIIRGAELETGEMILPSLRKYEESRKQPYVAMLDRLRRILTEREEIVLITAGYSFGDQHINEVIIEALEMNSGLHVFALCYEEPAEDSILAVTAREQRKLVVLAPDSAIVGGERGDWTVVDPEGSAGRLADVFALDEGTGPGGKLLLGDFNSFCKLLDVLARQGLND
jgi:hypothetical protein